MKVARVLRKRWRSAAALLGAVAALAAVGAVAVVAAFDSQHTVTSGPPPAAASPCRTAPTRTAGCSSPRHDPSRTTGYR